MRKILKKSFLCLGILLCYSYNATASAPSITTVTTTTDLSTVTDPEPYKVQFDTYQSPAELVIDTSGKTIMSIDLNASSATGIVINQGQDLLLGSVYDQQGGIGGGAQTTITLENDSTLTLTGDNYWAHDNSSTFLPNSFYYEDNAGPEVFLIDSSGQAITAENPSALQTYLWIQFYSGAIPQSSTSVYTGAYNLYSGVSSISLGAGANLIVDTRLSSSGNNALFIPNGLPNNSPTILTNAFNFVDSSAILTINTPLIVTHPSIGNFGRIASYNTINTMGKMPALAINAGNQTTIISSLWDNPTSLFALSDTTITDRSIAGSTIYIGTDASLYDSSVSLTIKPSGTWTTASHNGVSNFAYNGLYISYVYPLGNSTLILDSSSAASSDGVHFFSPDTGIGGWFSAPGSVLDLAAM